MPLSPGQILNNHYRVVKQLAQGGFGTIYRAWDMNLNGPCALKENLGSTRGSQAQFDFEANMLARLSHPNLPKVRDHFSIPEGQFLVMDYIDGDDLEVLRKRSGGALAEAQVLDWTRQVGDALAYLHSQNPPVIHRDIKPANIKITPQGQAFLVDFGIAKQQAMGPTATAAKGVSASYSPPEQYTGGTTTRSDIYSLGATVYTLLTGIELPDAVQRLIPQGGGAPAAVRPPHLMRPGISPVVSQAVMRAIHPEASKRFATVTEFLVALAGQQPVNQPGKQPAVPVPIQAASQPFAQQPGRARAGQPVQVTPPAGQYLAQGSPAVVYPPAVPQKQVRRPVQAGRVVGIGMAVVAFLAVIGAGVFFAWQMNQGTGGGTAAQPTNTVVAAAQATKSGGTAAPGSTASAIVTLTSAPQAGVATNTPASKPAKASSATTQTPGAPTPTVDPNGLNAVNVTTQSSSESGIRVEVLYGDGTPKVGSWVGVYQQTVDVSNNPLEGERLADARTDNSGAVFFSLPPGTYALNLGDSVGYLWGNRYNYQVQSGTTIVVRVQLGRLKIGMRNAEGQPLTGRWVGVYLQEKDISGNPVSGERVADGRTNDAGLVTFDLTPGLYTVELGDLYGEVWGEKQNHAVLRGKETNILLTTGRLVVGVVNADGQPIQRRWVGVSFQRKDVTGQPTFGDRFVEGYTDATGAVSWDITAGTYGVKIGDLAGYPWGEELNHPIITGQTTKILVEMGRFIVGLKDNSSSPIAGKYVAVYLQKKDAAGSITTGDLVADQYTGSDGLVGFDLTPGAYIVRIGDENNLSNVTVEARRTTFFDGNKQEFR